jgi:hypothetical protein
VLYHFGDSCAAVNAGEGDVHFHALQAVRSDVAIMKYASQHVKQYISLFGNSGNCFSPSPQ